MLQQKTNNLIVLDVSKFSKSELASVQFFLQKDLNIIVNINACKWICYDIDSGAIIEYSRNSQLHGHIIRYVWSIQEFIKTIKNATI